MLKLIMVLVQFMVWISESPSLQVSKCLGLRVRPRDPETLRPGDPETQRLRDPDTLRKRKKKLHPTLTTDYHRLAKEVKVMKRAT